MPLIEGHFNYCSNVYYCMYYRGAERYSEKQKITPSEEQQYNYRAFINITYHSKTQLDFVSLFAFCCLLWVWEFNGVPTG